MSKLDYLSRRIYHEKQQSGSMLCAQHALNNLLQGNYFTAPDLSEIAKNLDSLEQSYDEDNRGASSSNMDDTGYFSVQVLENALSVWGLNLARWRGEEMRPYQDHPHNQQAFILNYQEHWYTLRRFGLDDEERGHWFDLNSLLPAPKWVGRLYLGMVLQQAEADGYSVFVIRPQDSSNSLPHTEVDEVASTMAEDTLQDPLEQEGQEAPYQEGLEDEDWELQAALHASLGGALPEAPIQPPQLHRRPIPLPESGPASGIVSGNLSPTFRHDLNPSFANPPYLPADEDDVDAAQLAEASRERNRRMLEQMAAEQHQAQRELWQGGNRPVQRNPEDDYEEMLRRAIAESEALAQTDQQRSQGEDEDEDVDVDDDMNVDVPQQPPQIPSVQRDRVYDDDDAELQAALKASLEEMPTGWVPLEQPPTAPSALSTTALSPPVTGRNESDPLSDDEDEDESEAPSESDQHAPVTVDADELRRRRLARFGA